MIAIQNKTRRAIWRLFLRLALLAAVLPSSASSIRWNSLTVADGLPSNRVLCLAANSDTVWAGTDAGVAVVRHGKIVKTIGTKDGLAGRIISALALDADTGDLWVAMYGGISRISAGAVRSYTSLDSGLANDVVYDIAVQGHFVLAATAAGLSQFDMRSQTWTTYDNRNSPMVDPWPVRIIISEGTAYIGTWGNGVLKFDISTGIWTLPQMPTERREMGLIQHGDEGIEFVRGLAYDASSRILWSASARGLAARGEQSTGSGGMAMELVPLSTTINTIKLNENYLWVCTNEGLKVIGPTDAGSQRDLVEPPGPDTAREHGAAAMADNELIPERQVFDITFQGGEFWVASASGLWRGERIRSNAQRPGVPGGLRKVPDRSVQIKQSAWVHSSDHSSAAKDTVNIGFLGPVESITDTSRGMAMLHGAQLAVDEANARGTKQGGPTRGKWVYSLKVHNDSAQWGAGTMEPVRMVEDENVVAVLGSIDGSVTHTLLRISEELGFPVINTAATDPTIRDTGTPWLVSIAPDDRQQSKLLAETIVGQKRIRKLGIIYVDNRDTRIAIATFFQEFGKLGHIPVVKEIFPSGITDLSEQLQRLKDAKIDALLIWCEPDQGALVLKQMRTSKLWVPTFGSSSLADPAVIALSGIASEGLVVVGSLNSKHTGQSGFAFDKSYREKFGEPPDAFAVYAYDGMNLLIAAIEEAGPDRQAILSALRSSRLRGRQGVIDRIVLNEHLSNVAQPLLARVVQGQFAVWNSAGGK
ncbi:MAG: ABC transporter substrate-binding protein [Formivibrio sp.]|nr:ABC transporter substrate-binding protein [Formivibrio sp.]